MVEIKIVDFFEMNNLTFKHLFASRIVFPENEFFNFVKTVFMDKTRTVGQTWMHG